jgi:hypothetical protein
LHEYRPWNNDRAAGDGRGHHDTWYDDSAHDHSGDDDTRCDDRSRNADAGYNRNDDAWNDNAGSRDRGSVDRSLTRLSCGHVVSGFSRISLQSA